MVRGVAIVLLVVLAVVYAENYTWGYRQHNDRLLNRTFSRKSSKLFQVVTLDIQFPNKTVSGSDLLKVQSTIIPDSITFQAPVQRANISQIVLIDQKPKGKGGYASLTSGGIGFNHTSIRMKSQRGEGLDFIVDIYGV